MFFVFGSLLNPFDEQGFFFIREREVTFGGRHYFFGVFGQYAGYQFAVVDIPRVNGFGTAFQFERGPVEIGQLQASFDFGLIRTVAFKTAVRQDGLDVQVVVNVFG